MASKFDEANKLIDYYKSQYKLKYNDDPIIARSKVKYPLIDALADFTLEQLKKLVNFYLNTETEPSLNDFAYDYSDVFIEYKKFVASHKERNIIRTETGKRVQEYRERYGKK